MLVTVLGSVLKAALLCILQQVEVNALRSIFHTNYIGGGGKLHVSCTGKYNKEPLPKARYSL